MSEPSASTLSNSFLAVRLIALREWPVMAMQGSGPFLVTQWALDPDDPGLDPDDFLLTRSGAWLRFESFLDLDWDLAREEACFDSAAEVMVLLERLPSKAGVERIPASSDQGRRTANRACREVLPAAVYRAVRGEGQPPPDAIRPNPPPNSYLG